MKKINTAKFISIGGILTTLAVIFQSAPVFLPIIGFALSPLSTLPIAVAAVYNISLGIAVYFSSALLLTLVSVQEATVLLFTTGLLGVVMGTLLYRKGRLIAILFSSIILTLGMTLLTYIVGVPAFGDLTGSASTPLTMLIFSIFSLIYVSIWNICLRKFINFLLRIKVIDNQ